MQKLEWNGLADNGVTKRGEDVMRLSKDGNIRIVYDKYAVQGKYKLEKRVTNGYAYFWDRFDTAKYSSDFIGEVEKAAMYMIDEPRVIE